MIFRRLTSGQVTSVHKLYSLLRILRVIGVVKTTTEQTYITESGRPIRYNLKFISYDASMRGQNTAEERLVSFFNQVYDEDIENCTRQID